MVAKSGGSEAVLKLLQTEREDGARVGSVADASCCG
jgi:hypothetical protein